MGLGVARQAAAFGGTSEPWVAGTQPWDTVPYHEANVGLQANGGQGRPEWGPTLQVGLWDQLMLAGTWSIPVNGGEGHGEAMAVLREAAFPRWRPALGLATRATREVDSLGAPINTWQPLMLIAAIEPWDHSFVVNVEPWGLRPLFRAGYWSPYVLSFVRLGVEAQAKSDFQGGWTYAPQAALQTFGDVSLIVGGVSGSQDPSVWAWMVRLSYQLFPSP